MKKALLRGEYKFPNGVIFNNVIRERVSWGCCSAVYSAGTMASRVMIKENHFDSPRVTGLTFLGEIPATYQSISVPLKGGVSNGDVKTELADVIKYGEFRSRT
jgi:hypothetical protein